MTTTNKPIIETLVNSVALALTSLGVVMITNKEYIGMGIILFAMCLEFFKYWGRQKKYW